MTEGYFLMGFGTKYIDECIKMVETLKVFDQKLLLEVEVFVKIRF